MIEGGNTRHPFDAGSNWSVSEPVVFTDAWLGDNKLSGIRKKLI
jgi:hypothetical protein